MTRLSDQALGALIVVDLMAFLAAVAGIVVWGPSTAALVALMALGYAQMWLIVLAWSRSPR